MLRNYAKHYRIVDTEAEGSWASVAELAISSSNPFPADYFAQHLVYRTERKVNWAVTFARRGLILENYYETSSTDTTCTFTVHDHGKSKGPKTITFDLLSHNPEAILQGDTVTYVDQTAGLYLRHYERVQHCFSMKYLRRVVGEHKGTVYWTGLLPKELPRHVNRTAYDQYRSRIADHYSAERSVLAIHIY